MLIYSFAFVLCYFLLFIFPPKINILTKETNVNECNEKITTGTIKQRQLRMRNEIFFNKKRKKIIYSRIATGETLHSSRLSRYMVIVFVPQSFMRRCSRSFHCSRSKRLQRVVHTTPIARTNICVLSKLTWRL